MKKIKLKESELVDLIEKLVKENLGNGNGQNFGLMGTPTAKYKDLIEDEDIESEDELEEDYEDVDHEDRDEFDGRKSRVVGVDSDIDKQRMGEAKKRTLSLSENQLINLIQKIVKEQEEPLPHPEIEFPDDEEATEDASVEEIEDADILVDDDIETDVDENELTDDEDSWVAERWEDLTDAVRNIFSRNKKFFGCRGKGTCPNFNRMNRRRKLRILTNLTIAFPKFRWPKFRFRLPRYGRFSLRKLRKISNYPPSPQS